MTTHALIADIEQALATATTHTRFSGTYEGQAFDWCADCQQNWPCDVERTRAVLAECRAALVGYAGIEQTFPAPDGWPPHTRDCDAVPDDDETVARAARGARAH
jgi:hypothetical protein